jgi:hypothetical protein
MRKYLYRKLRDYLRFIFDWKISFWRLPQFPKALVSDRTCFALRSFHSWKRGAHGEIVAVLPTPKLMRNSVFPFRATRSLMI